jgi:hypothetical protein
VATVLRARIFEPWHLKLLRENRLSYVIMDSRKVSDRPIGGQYFPRPGEPRHAGPAGEKFDNLLGADRLLDGGNAVVYHLRDQAYRGVMRR